MTRIHLINVSMTEAGREARSAVIFMTSAFHKNEAIIRVKTFLRQRALHRVQAEDCFPPTQLEAVRALRSYGHRLKATGEIAKYRVVNREGVAVLQTGVTTDGRYEDTPLPTEGARQNRNEAGGRGRGERERSVEAGGQPAMAEGRAGDQPEERRRRAPPATQAPRVAEQRRIRGSEAATVNIVERPEVWRGDLQGTVTVKDSGINSSMGRETEDVTEQTAPTEAEEGHVTSTTPLPRDQSPWSMEAPAPMPPALTQGKPLKYSYSTHPFDNLIISG
jgi:hypothetical protein